MRLLKIVCFGGDNFSQPIFYELEDIKGYVTESVELFASANGTVLVSNGRVSIEGMDYPSNVSAPFRKGDRIKLYINHQSNTAGKRVYITWNFE